MSEPVVAKTEEKSAKKPKKKMQQMEVIGSQDLNEEKRDEVVAQVSSKKEKA